MNLRGVAAPSIFSQTIRYSKVSLDLAKKSTLYGKKNRFFFLTLAAVRIILGAIRVI